MRGRPMSSSTTSGRNSSAAATPRRRHGPSHLVARHLEQHRERDRGVLVVVDDENAAGRGRAGVGSRPPPCGLASAVVERAGARRTRSPCPSAVAPGLDRAAVHLDEPLDERQADAQPALRRARGSGRPARTCRRCCRACRRECRCRCPARETTASPSCALGGQRRSGRRAPCTWQRCSAGSNTWARRAASASR